MTTPKADDPGVRLIKIEALARVEGEGGVRVLIRDGRVEDAQVRIFEAPRLFESILRGRGLEEPPDLTARICGICPVAYQMSACHAVEAALGVVIDPAVRLLRRLLYCGEWIESHALHVVCLHAPDFLGQESVLAMAGASPDLANCVRRFLKLKKAGNSIVHLLGGREIHPINARVGGFHRAPRKGELNVLLEPLKEALDLALELVRWVAAFDFPQFEHDYEFVALRHESEYPMNEGRLISSRGLDIAMNQFLDHFEEQQVPYSNALQCRKKATGTAYFVGPLARINLNFDHLSPTAKQIAGESGIAWPSRNPFTGIVARAVEIVHAVEVAIDLIQQYEPPARSAVPLTPRAGTGNWITEAPRGILFHQYQIDAKGLVTHALIIPPTSQNQRQIEEDLIRFAPRVLDLPQHEAEWCCEHVVRNYDPCISCATHFLKFEVQR